MNTPVLIIIFNRPEITRKIVEALRIVKPSKLFITADGARLNRLGEKEICDETRNVIDSIDWPCTIQKKYSETNQGCDSTVETGVTWFFENVEAGIILEDDCIPDPTFFDFVTRMLEKYKENEKIMHINGSNFQFGKQRGNGSYYFSRYPYSHGWASWRRAWKYYNHKLSSFPEFRKNNCIDIIVREKNEKRFWLNFFSKIYREKFPFWDSRWVYAIWSHEGICITSNHNLINNIGWGKDATHTSIHEESMDRKVIPMAEIIYQNNEKIDEEADQYTFWQCYYRSFWQKLYYKIHRIFK